MLEKFRITHGWKDNHKENRWNIALEGFGVIWTENESDYKSAMEDGFVDIDVGESYSSDSV